MLNWTYQKPNYPNRITRSHRPNLCVMTGKETVHELFGTRVAVLAGDFMFAQASWYLANLENLEVIKLISQVLNYSTMSQSYEISFH